MFSRWLPYISHIEVEAGRIAMVSATCTPVVAITDIDENLVPLLYIGVSELIQNGDSVPFRDWLVPDSKDERHQLREKERYNGRLAMLACISLIFESQ